MTEQQRRQLVIVACWWAGILFALLWFQFPYVRGLFQQPPPFIYSLYAIAVVYVALRTATVFALPIIATRTQHTAFNWLGSDHWLVLPDMLLLTSRRSLHWWHPKRPLPCLFRSHRCVRSGISGSVHFAHRFRCGSSSLDCNLARPI